MVAIVPLEVWCEPQLDAEHVSVERSNLRLDCQGWEIVKQLGDDGAHLLVVHHGADLSRLHIAKSLDRWESLVKLSQYWLWKIELM
jgi:hypothetical protein